MRSYRSIYNFFGRVVAILLALQMMIGCALFRKSTAEDDLNNSVIAYPFVQESYPIGNSPAEERFIIRTAAGGTEYTVEIPGAARNYDVEVPLADIRDGSVPGPNTRSEKELRPQVTDREFVGEMKKTDGVMSDSGLVDSAFGVGNKNGPSQSPSYTIGVARATQLFKERKYEFSLIEINNLIAFYPTSSRLYKMKGTVLIRLRSAKLAQRAWMQALDLNPADSALRKSLKKLQHRNDLEDRAALAASPKVDGNVSAGQPGIEPQTPAVEPLQPSSHAPQNTTPLAH